MVIKVGIDQGADLKALRELQRRGVVELRQANELEQTWRDVVQQKKGFMVGHTKLGELDEIVGEKAGEVERILGPDKMMDVAHIYAAYMNRCEFFVTQDTDFLGGDRKDRLEALLGVKIRRTEELIQELAPEG